MITFNNVNGAPMLTCGCGCVYQVSGKDTCWDCGYRFTTEDLQQYEEFVKSLEEDGKMKMISGLRLKAEQYCNGCGSQIQPDSEVLVADYNELEIMHNDCLEGAAEKAGIPAEDYEIVWVGKYHELT